MPSWATTVIEWAQEYPQLAVTAAVLVMTATAVTAWLARSLARAMWRGATATVRAAARLDIRVVGTVTVAILATIANLEAMWRFLAVDLGIANTLTRSVLVVLFDAAGIVAAILARDARLRAPGRLGLDTLLMWAIAVLMGYFGAAHAETTQGSVGRFAVAILAAIMWDRVIQREVARIVPIGMARLSTVTGRAVDAVARGLRAMRQAVMRQAARWGLIHPADEDIATIRQQRWRRQLVSRAARAADARRALDAVAALPVTDRRRRRAQRRYDRTVPPFRAAIVAGQQLGAIRDRGDLDSVLWDSAVVIRAEDALTSAVDRSPWIDRVESGRSPIDGKVADRKIENDRPPHNRGRSYPIDRSSDQEPIGRSITSEPPKPIDQPVDRDQPAKPTPDRSATRRPRRTKAENDRIIRAALIDLLRQSDGDAIQMPSQREIAVKAGVAQSTVSAWLNRTNLVQIPELTMAHLTDDMEKK